MSRGRSRWSTNLIVWAVLALLVFWYVTKSGPWTP